MTEKTNFSDLRPRWLLVFVFSLSFLVAVTSACGSTASAPTLASDLEKSPSPAVTEEGPKEALVTGNTQDGKVLFVTKACSGCHTVQGFPEAKGKVGPELIYWTIDS